MTRLRTEVVRFIVVGLVNAAITCLIFYTMLRILQLHYIGATIVTWSIGIVFAYIFNFIWVFKPDQRLQFRGRFVKFVVTYLTSFGVNILALDHLVRIYGFDPFHAQVALIPLIVIFNFVVSKFWSLRPEIADANAEGS